MNLKYLIFGILLLSLGFVYAETMPYWIEDYGNGYNLWVKIPYIPANGDTVVYIEKDSNYKPDGDKVFEFFDDFEGNIPKDRFNLESKWYSVDSWAGYDTTCKNYPYQKDGVLIARTDQGWGGLKIASKESLNVNDVKIVSRVYCDKTINPNPNIMVGFSDRTPIKRVGDWKTDAILKYTSYYNLTGERPEKGNYYMVKYIKHDAYGWYPYIGEWDGEYHFLYVYVRKYAYKEPTTTITKINDNLYKITIHNPNNYPLKDFQVKIPNPSFITSKFEGLKITDKNPLQSNTTKTSTSTIPIEPKLATIYIESEPNDADIFINGEYKGITPLKLELKEGTYTIKIKKDGYKEYTKKITLKAGDSKEISINLKKDNNNITLIIGAVFGALIVVSGGVYAINKRNKKKKKKEVMGELEELLKK